MPDSTLKQAIKEAYAAAPDNVIIYHTLEFRHPSFTTPIRVVRDYTDLTATLEASAPVDAGQAVTFVRFAFNLVKPEVSATGVPQCTIEIDNVSRDIVANIEASLSSTSPISVTYREFISSDLSGPQNDPPITMSLLSVTADTFKVKAVAGFPDLVNRRFPTKEYDAETFSGLVS